MPGGISACCAGVRSRWNNSVREALIAVQVQTSSKEQLLLVNDSEIKQYNVFLQNRLTFS
jgi:hypothetical protein